MANVKVTKDIGAPVETVFALFTDLQRAPEQVSGIKHIDVLSLGAFGLGTRWREVRDVLGRDDEAEMEVTAFEKNRGYTITHRKGGMRIDATFAFEPTPSGTRVTVEFGLQRHGLPAGLFAPLTWAVSGKVRDVLATDLGDLKDAVEKLAVT